MANKDITRALASRKTSGLGLQGHLTTRYKKPSARTALSSKVRQMVRLSCKGLPQEYWASQQPACQALSQKRRICPSFRIFPESGGEVRTVQLLQSAFTFKRLNTFAAQLVLSKRDLQPVTALQAHLGRRRNIGRFLPAWRSLGRYVVFSVSTFRCTLLATQAYC